MQRRSEEVIEQIVEKDPRYPGEAYEFVRDSLDYTIKLFKKSAVGKDRHVTAQELLEGLRRHALEQFGPLTLTVLQSWNFHACKDVGEVVFNMVRQNLLGRSEQDKLEDFNEGYLFEEAFRRPFEPPARKLPSRLMRSRSPKPAQSS